MKWSGRVRRFLGRFPFATQQDTVVDATSLYGSQSSEDNIELRRWLLTSIKPTRVIADRLGDGTEALKPEWSFFYLYKALSIAGEESGPTYGYLYTATSLSDDLPEQVIAKHDWRRHEAYSDRTRPYRPDRTHSLSLSRPGSWRTRPATPGRLR